jgi:hypothetical protein
MVNYSLVIVSKVRISFIGDPSLRFGGVVGIVLGLGVRVRVEC